MKVGLDSLTELFYKTGQLCKENTVLCQPYSIYQTELTTQLLRPSHPRGTTDTLFTVLLTLCTLLLLRLFADYTTNYTPHPRVMTDDW